MRAAVLSDIHSNLEALRAVMKFIDTLEVTDIFCLGDLVGYGPHPNECVELIRERSAIVLKGNHDAGATGELDPDHFNAYGRAALDWTKTVLSDENSSFLASLPMTAEREGAFLVHSSPAKPENWRYVLTWREAQECFQAFTTPVCFIGHTHVSVVIGEQGTVNAFERETRQLINVGSVGQPRDGNHRASFGLIDTDQWTYQNYRIEYDIQKTVDAITAAQLPEYLGRRLFLGI